MERNAQVRHRLVIRSAVVVVLMAGTAGRARALPITNADLEPPYVTVASSVATITGAIATGWEDNSQWADVSVNYSEETMNPHHGAACQRIDVAEVRSGAVELVQYVPLVGGQVYSVTFWLRGTSGMRVKVGLSSADPPYPNFASAQTVLTGDWQEITAKGISPQDVQGLVLASTSDAGSFCVDDVAVTERPGSVIVQPYAGAIPARYFGLHDDDFQFEAPRNPSFEKPYHTPTRSNPAVTGLVADGWVDVSDSSDVAVDYASDPVTPHAGSVSQKITVSRVTSGTALLVQQLRLPAGDTYRASVWLRGAPGESIRILVGEDAAPWTVYASKDVALSADWQEASIEVMVPTYRFYFGIEVGQTGSYWVDDAELVDTSAAKPFVADLPPARFGLLRLWDAGVTWSALEPQQGVWDFSLLDREVDLAAARGIPVMLTLGQSPTWASARPGDVNYIGAGAPAEPANLADWREYVATVAHRYAGRIQYYEVWNEPNDTTFYTGSVGALVELTHQTRLALDGADPLAQLVSPAAYESWWLDDFLTRGGAEYADIIGYHFYETPPEKLLAEIPTVRLILQDHGVDKPLWNTEGAAGDETLSDSLAAAYVARSYLVNLIAGNQQFNWYYWGRETTFCANMVQPDLVTPTPAGAALDAIRDWLVGARIVNAAQEADGTWWVAVTQASGSPAWILWNPDGLVHFAVPAAWDVRRRIDLYGGQRDITGVVSIAVDEAPILLEGVPMDWCVGAPPCAAADACHEPGVCDSRDGRCSSPAKADGSPCPGGSCQSGTCRHISATRGCACSLGHAATAPPLWSLFAIGLLGLTLCRRRVALRARCARPWPKFSCSRRSRR